MNYSKILLYKEILLKFSRRETLVREIHTRNKIAALGIIRTLVCLKTKISNESFLINFYPLCGVFISSVNKISTLSRIDGNLTKLDLDNGKLIQKRKGYFLVKSPRFIFSSLVMSVESRGIAIRETRYKVVFEGKRIIKLTMILHNVTFLKKA